MQFTKLFHAVKKQSKSLQKLRKKKLAYLEERAMQQKHLNEELTVVDMLHEKGSISDDLRARYRKMLELGYTQKLQETREKFGFTNTEINVVG